MKKVFFNPKLTKAEAVYLKKLQDRPSDTIFREVHSKVQNNYKNPSEITRRNVTMKSLDLQKRTV
jgi:hypothetical protein